MRVLCNLLVGLPIFGVIIGALLLIFQDLSGMAGSGMLDCEQLTASLPFGLDSQSSVIEAVRWLCGLPLGGHIVLASFIMGCVTVPVGLVIYRSKGLDTV